MFPWFTLALICWLHTFFFTFHLYPDQSKSNASGGEANGSGSKSNASGGHASGPRVNFTSATFDPQSYNHGQQQRRLRGGRPFRWNATAGFLRVSHHALPTCRHSIG